MRALREQFPHIQHVILQENRGYAGGVNAGLRAAFEHSDWAILLTNDSSLKTLPELPQYPCIVAPRILCKNSLRVDSLGGRFIPERATLQHCKTPEEFRVASGYPYIPGTAFLVHREVFEKSGPLHERLCIYWDDVEWSRRIARTGYGLEIQVPWLVSNGLHKTGKGNPLYTLYYFQRNKKWICWRFSRPLMRVKLMVVLLRDWLRLGFRLAKSGRWTDMPYLLRTIVE